jgi:hypothetical protein
MSDWSPLKRSFYAESTDDGIEFAHTYYAPDDGVAKIIANKQGWKFMGEVQDVGAMNEESWREYIDMIMRPPVVH